VEHIVRMGKMKSLYRLMVRGMKGKRPLGRTGSRWVDNMKRILKE
jgi:hypothetical protein